MSAMTAKAVISSVSEPSDGQQAITMTADYADGANKEWAKYTPGLSVSMTVLEEIVQHVNLRPGAKVTIKFKVEEEPSPVAGEKLQE